jgi:putative transposase
MPRVPRIFVDGAIYHVYCRIGRGEPVFGDDAEAGDLLELLAELKARDDLQVLAWCVMSNHYHLALRSGSVPLWRTMRLLQGRFSKSYNARHQTYGPLWQGRYRAKLVAGESHLAQVIAYIHLNPVAAGVVRDPARYRWSGHRELLGEVHAPLIDVDAALAVFGDPIEVASRTYARTLAELAGTPWVAGVPGGLPWWSASRRGPRASPPVEEPRPAVDALGASTAPERPRLSPLEFLDLAAAAVGTSETELRSPRGRAALARQRELVALLAVELFGVRVKDLATALGRSPGSVSRWVNAAGDRRARDAAYRRSAGELAAAITEAARSARAARSGFVYGGG